MSFDVLLAEDAERDIEELYRYIATHDDSINADRVLQSLEELCAS